MEPVHRSVDADGYVVFAHFIEEGGDTGAAQVSSSPRYDRTNVSDVFAVLIDGVSDPQLGQDLSAIRVLPLGIAVADKTN